MGTQLPLPPPKKKTGGQAHVYCGQTAAWIKMQLGMKVGLGPGHTVLDGDLVPPPQKGATAPNFRPMSIVHQWLDGSRCHLVWR